MKIKMNKKNYKFSGFAKMMGDTIERLEHIIDGDVIEEKNEALTKCYKHLIEATAILRECKDKSLNNEISLLETIMTMVQEKIIE